MSDLFHPARRDLLVGAVFAAGLTGLATMGDAHAADLPLGGPTGDIHDFDYHLGHWTAVQRRLKQRGTATPEWDEFPSNDFYTQYLGGLVNVDQVNFPTKGWAGLTVRTFNRARRQWFIYWISSRTGELGDPMIGGFNGNVGLFYGDDEDDGVPVNVRFTRTKQPPDHERWEQAFSRDGGANWETNWTADFTRVG